MNVFMWKSVHTHIPTVCDRAGSFVHMVASYVCIHVYVHVLIHVYVHSMRFVHIITHRLNMYACTHECFHVEDSEY